MEWVNSNNISFLGAKSKFSCGCLLSSWNLNNDNVELLPIPGGSCVERRENLIN